GAPAGVVRARELDGERDAEDRLVEHLADVSHLVVLAEEFSVIGGDDHERVLPATTGPQGSEELAERLVHERELAIIVRSDEALLRLRQVADRVLVVQVLPRQPVRAGDLAAPAVVRRRGEPRLLPLPLVPAPEGPAHRP